MHESYTYKLTARNFVYSGTILYIELKRKNDVAKIYKTFLAKSQI